MGSTWAESRRGLRSVEQTSRAATGRSSLQCFAAVILAAASLANAADERGSVAHSLRTWGSSGAPAIGSSFGLPTRGLSPSGSLLALRLKGGRGCTGVRNSCKQRKYTIREGVQKHAKRNRPIALSHKPCSGPWALSKIERAHGPLVIQMVKCPLPSPDSQRACWHVRSTNMCCRNLRLGARARASPRVTS